MNEQIYLCSSVTNHEVSDRKTTNYKLRENLKRAFLECSSAIYINYIKSQTDVSIKFMKFNEVQSVNKQE